MQGEVAFSLENDGGVDLERKHNKCIVPIAKILRKNMTKEERHLWYDFLRNYPIKIMRQKIIGKYIVDFYCAKAKLVIELDGSGHFDDKTEIYDNNRTLFLNEYGLKVIRIPNNDVNKNFNNVCEYIDYVIKQSLSQQS